MGYKTEINYILKASDKTEGSAVKDAPVGSFVTIKKSGLRTFVLNSPIMIADSDWRVRGMCLITKSEVSTEKTILTAKILTKFSEEHSVIVSQLIQEAEKLK